MRFIIAVMAFSFLSITLHAEELALNWKPEPEFGGFYQALKLKAYDKAGMKLSILPGGAGQPVTQMVAGKKALFGIAAADEVILARAQGAKVVALFAVYQTDPQGFMVHPERNFKSLQEVFQISRNGGTAKRFALHPLAREKIPTGSSEDRSLHRRHHFVYSGSAIFLSSALSLQNHLPLSAKKSSLKLF